MDKIHAFVQSVYSPETSKLNDDLWDKAIEDFKQEQYKSAVFALLDYVDPELRKNFSVENGYEIPHGSVKVRVEIINDQLKIYCPFLDIKDSKKVPLMRKLAELKQHPLNLANISVSDDQAHFFFNCNLHNAEPYKIYNILREICVFADRYDDEFIEKYNAARLQEPEISALESHVKNDAWLTIKNTLEDGLARFDHYMSKRWGNFAWYALNIALKKVEYYVQPQGYYRTLLERSIDELYNRRIPFFDALMNAKSKVEALLKYEEQNLKDDLYTINTFVPYKYKGSIENIRDNWEDTFESVQQMMNNNSHEEASLSITSAFYNLFYYNNVADDVREKVESALKESSGLSWNAGSGILFKAMEDIMEDNLQIPDFGGMDLAKAMEENMAQSMEMMQSMLKGFFK